MDRDYAEPLDVPALARVALMSPGHFSRSFRAAVGETPYSYLMTRRIERAKALLRRGDLQVTEVCFAVGCTSRGSFSSRFTELVGESPSSYRARGHDEGAAIPACVAKIGTRPVRNGEANPAPAPKRPAGGSARNPPAAKVSCPGGSGQHPGRTPRRNWVASAGAMPSG
jgi:AraC-like DNA-binding protein